MSADATIADVLAGRAAWCVAERDCLVEMAALDPGDVDHVITDPPYEAEAHTKSRRSHRGSPTDPRGFVSMPIDFGAITPDVREAAGRQFARLARRWCLIFCQLEGVRPWRDACEPHGLRHMRSCIWVKPDSAPQFTGDRPGTGYECIEALHAKPAARWNGGGRRGVFEHNCQSQLRNPAADHPTVKPTSLMLELVELFTDPGELILDPFAGSGTTGVAALRLGRRCILIEREPKYHAIAVERLRAEENGQSLREARAGQIPMFPAEAK